MDDLKSYLRTLAEDDLKQLLNLYELQLAIAKGNSYREVIYIREKQIEILKDELNHRKEWIC